MPVEHIGRYEIKRQLGKGAMGVVYEATDPNIGRTVALKTMRLDVHGEDAEEMLKRFKNEAKAAGVLNHPNIVTIYDAGEVEGIFYIAMEYITGTTLLDTLHVQKVLPLEKIIEYTSQICAGLDYAHAKGVIHRDIKPANIMLTGEGVAKITDFGIAKAGAGMTSTGSVVGTPNYMSPEQVRGRQLDGRSDIFSLGVMLYEMLTGERPFSGTNVTTIIYKIVNEHPPAPAALDATIHPGLSAVVTKALAKSPAQRYASGAELAHDLHNYERIGTEETSAHLPAAEETAAPAPPPVAHAPAAAAAAPAAEHHAPPPRPKPPVPPPGPSPIRTKAEAEAARKASLRPAPKPAATLDESTVSAPHQAKRGGPVRPSSRAPLIAVVAGVVVLALAGLGYMKFRTRSVAEAPAPAATETTPAPQPSPPPATPSKPRAAAPKPSTEPATAPAETATAPSATTGELRLTSLPTGVSVQIDGRSEPGWVTPFTASKLSPGQHTVVFSKPGFSTDSKPVNVTAGKRSNIIGQLSATQGFLVVVSNPAGASVLLDGKDTGQKTPARLAVDPGQHRVSLRLDGFNPEAIVVEAKAGQTFNFAPQLKPGSGSSASQAAQKTEAAPSSGEQTSKPSPFGKLKRLFGGGDQGTVEIKTTPKGAEIKVDGNVAPKKTPTKFSLDPGKYHIVLTLKGYKPIARDIEVEKGKTFGIEEIFEKQ